MNRTRQTVNRSEDARLLTTFVNAGDEDAFAQLVRKYERLVWNICCRILHNRCDAEDAFQSTFLLLATKAHRIRKPKSLSSWLYGVAYRTASSIRRQRQRDMIPYEQSVDNNLPDNVLEYVAQKNENELVSAELMLMKERYKTPLLMFYFMGNSTAQIADTLGLSTVAVESRLRQARRSLQRRLRLRGIDFGQCCLALGVPTLAMNPTLPSTIIGNISTAAVTKGLTGLFSNLVNSMNQTGAKLMLIKIAVSMGIVCMASVGAIHQGTTNSDGEYSTVVMGDQQPAAATMSIKFVQDDDDENSSEQSQALEHLKAAHDHLYHLWKKVADGIMGKQQPHAIAVIDLGLERDLEIGPVEVEVQLEPTVAVGDRLNMQFYRAVLTTPSDLKARPIKLKIQRTKLPAVELNVLPQSATEKLDIQPQLFHALKLELTDRPDESAEPMEQSTANLYYAIQLKSKEGPGNSEDK